MRAKMVMMAMAVVASALLWVGTGCEEADGINGLAVTPSSFTLSGSTNSVVFTASVSNSLALPLEWSVANSDLGRIERASGSSAVYVATGGTGDNVITVRDQYKNEGSAVVSQK